jgi:hypothetical protein
MMPRWRLLKPVAINGSARGTQKHHRMTSGTIANHFELLRKTVLDENNIEFRSLSKNYD